MSDPRSSVVSMTGHRDSRVRPTLRALTEDLELPVPTVDVPLETVSHAVIARAQGIPAMQADNGAERILSLADRVWLKVKTGRYRGAVTNYIPDPELHKARWLTGWWLGFAGKRFQGDRRDAYVQAQARSSVTKDQSPSGVDTTWMLPTERDANRRAAEFAAREEVAMRRQVLAMIAESARTGRMLTTTYGHHSLEVLVKVPDNLTYLAIGLTGVHRVEELATLLDCVPGVPRESWGVEPGDVLGITPRPGQIVFSTILDPVELAPLLDEYPEGTLDVSGP